MKALMKTLCTITGIISAVAAANIGFSDWFNFDIVSLFGEMSWIIRWVFGASGIVALAMYIMHMLGIDCGCE